MEITECSGMMKSADGTLKSEPLDHHRYHHDMSVESKPFNEVVYISESLRTKKSVQLDELETISIAQCADEVKSCQDIEQTEPSELEEPKSAEESFELESQDHVRTDELPKLMVSKIVGEVVDRVLDTVETVEKILGMNQNCDFSYQKLKFQSFAKRS